MKKCILLSIIFFSILTTAESQIRLSKEVNQPVTIRQTQSLPVKTLMFNNAVPGSFAETTPLVNAPIDPVKNSVTLFTNTVPNAYKEDPNTKFYFLDESKDGKDKLLAFNTQNFNSRIKIERDNSGVFRQVASYAIVPGIKYTDELLTGYFTEEGGATLVVDRRSNQFYCYQQNNNFPHNMLSNWAIADRYLAGDFNGDGKSDLLGWNFSRNEFQVALYTKSSTPGVLPLLQPSGVWLSGWAQSADMNIVTGDFNGDKKDDIALVHQPSGEWWVALSTGTGFQPSAGYKNGVWLKPWAAGTHHKIVAMDVNNDGICDLVEYDYNNKSFQAVLSNGQYFDYSFKREYIGNVFQGIQQVGIGKYAGSCMIVVSHVLPPDAHYLHPRPAGSVYLANYKR